MCLFAKVLGCGVICFENANKVKANKHNRVLLEMLEVWPNFAIFWRDCTVRELSLWRENTCGRSPAHSHTRTIHTMTHAHKQLTEGKIASERDHNAHK